MVASKKPEGSHPMSVIRKGTTAARLLLGLVFVVFGLNFFLHFLPMPPIDGPAATFFGGLVAIGYVLPTVKVIEVAAGAALLGNRFVPLALTLLAPIIVNIVAFHTVTAAGAKDVVLPLVILALEVLLAWRYRAAFRPMLQARVEPTTDDATDARPIGAAVGRAA
jgi:putative oxidoreductase